MAARPRLISRDVMGLDWPREGIRAAGLRDPVTLGIVCFSKSSNFPVFLPAVPGVDIVHNYSCRQKFRESGDVKSMGLVSFSGISYRTAKTRYLGEKTEMVSTRGRL